MEIFYADADRNKHDFVKRLFQNNSDHRVVYTTASGRELLETLAGYTPELLIMDFILLDCDGFYVLQQLSSSLSRPPKTMIYSCITQEQLLSQALVMGAKAFVYKANPSRELLQAADWISAQQHAPPTRKEATGVEYSPALMQTVSQLITQVGILPNLKGYQYSRDAILKLVQCPSILELDMCEIYSTLGQKYDTKPYCIERNIRNAIEIAWIKGNIRTINDLFGYTVKPEKGKPTNAEFLLLLADKVRLMWRTGA